MTNRDIFVMIDGTCSVWYLASMKSLLFLALLLGTAWLIFRVIPARAQGVDRFIAGNKKTAATLTDERLDRFLVFWRVREESSRSARPSVLRGLRAGGFDGAKSAAQSPETAPVFANAEEAAAAESGLSVQEGMALFMLLSSHYMGIYSATNRNDAAHLASVRSTFDQMYGAAALALVTRHEGQFTSLIQKQMETLRKQMSGADQ